MEIIQIGAGKSWVCMLYCSMGVHVSCGPVFLVDEITAAPCSSGDGSNWLAAGAQDCHSTSDSHQAEFSYLTEYIACIFQTGLLSFLVEGEH